MSISTVYRNGNFDLVHPDLRGLTFVEAYLRAEFPFKYFRPASSRINWYGAAKREGGRGMYMTEDQAKDWPMEQTPDIKVGPF